MNREPISKYLESNQFRAGRGLVLGLDPQQEYALEEFLKGYTGKYRALTNNCTDPIEKGLIYVGARDPSSNSLLPSGLARSLAALAIGQTAYPGPQRTFAAPWSVGVMNSLRTMY